MEEKPQLVRPSPIVVAKGKMGQATSPKSGASHTDKTPTDALETQTNRTAITTIASPTIRQKKVLPDVLPPELAALKATIDNFNNNREVTQFQKI